MKKYSKKNIRGKLDALVGEYFRNRPCEFKLTTPEHECSGRMEWSHCKSRRYLSTRWLLINAFSLCSSAHFWFENNPDLFTAWINKNYPGRLKKLQKAFNITKPIKKWELENMYLLLLDELKIV
jgi:hypothetical protein